EIGLAATVRANDAGESGLDHELTRLDEGLETDQPQLGELHAALPWRARCPRQRKELPNLEKGIDNRRHLLNRHRSRILLSVDEERRRGGYAQLRAFCTHGP